MAESTCPLSDLKTTKNIKGTGNYTEPGVKDVPSLGQKKKYINKVIKTLKVHAH